MFEIRSVKKKEQLPVKFWVDDPPKIDGCHTERVKGQAADLLDLYNVRVRKNSPANTLSNPNGLNASSQDQVNNITTGGNVNAGVLLSQEEQDNEYEEAVKAGDTEKAKQMLQ